MIPHIIYYYQTFVGLGDILSLSHCPVTHLMVSSLHFGRNTDRNKSPYIHLNDFPPTDERFLPLWHELAEAKRRGITLMFMLGGAGGAYGALFSDYETYYPMLVKTLHDHPEISGLELDIEEEVSLEQVRRLITDLNRDMTSSFILTMAPIASALIDNEPGLGGFNYKELAETLEGQRINWFNVQCYGEYSLEVYESILRAGWSSEKIVMGMISGSTDNFRTACHELQRIYQRYPDSFAGVDVWEYCNCPPDPTNHSQWAQCVAKILLPNTVRGPTLRDELRDFSLNKKKCKLL